MVSNAQIIRMTLQLAFSLLLTTPLAAQTAGNPPPPSAIQRMALGSNGEQPDAFVGQPVLSKSGRFVMFSTRARSLLPGMPPPSVVHSCPQPVYKQWYVFDRTTHQLDRVSVNNQGQPQSGMFLTSDTACTGFDTRNAFISDDGRYVVYESSANNLVPDDTNNATDVFIFDRTQRLTRRLSDDTDTLAITQGNAPNRFQISLLNVNFSLGRAAYRCRPSAIAPYYANLCFRDFASLQLTVIDPPGDQTSIGPISQSLEHLLIYNKNELYANDGHLELIFRLNLNTNSLDLISVGQGGELPSIGFGVGREVASISDDGSSVLFSSGGANNLSNAAYEAQGFGSGNLYLWEATLRTNRLVTLNDNGRPSSTNRNVTGSISGNGRYVIFNSEDLSISNFRYTSFSFERNRMYIRDLVTDKLYPAALDMNGGTGAWAGSCDNLGIGASVWIPNSAPAHCPAINFDGSVIAFSSYAGNWVPGDTLLTEGLFQRALQDVFVRPLNWTGLIPSSTLQIPVNSVTALMLLAILTGLGGIRVLANP